MDIRNKMSKEPAISAKAYLSKTSMNAYNNLISRERKLLALWDDKGERLNKICVQFIDSVLLLKSRVANNNKSP